MLVRKALPSGEAPGASWRGRIVLLFLGMSRSQWDARHRIGLALMPDGDSSIGPSETLYQYIEFPRMHGPGPRGALRESVVRARRFPVCGESMARSRRKRDWSQQT